MRDWTRRPRYRKPGSPGSDRRKPLLQSGLSITLQASMRSVFRSRLILDSGGSSAMTTKIACLTTLLVLATLGFDDAKKENAADKDKEENLLVNGSFEDGPDPNKTNLGFVWLNEGSKELKGWTVTRGQLSYV